MVPGSVDEAMADGQQAHHIAALKGQRAALQLLLDSWVCLKDGGRAVKAAVCGGQTNGCCFVAPAAGG